MYGTAEDEELSPGCVGACPAGGGGGPQPPRGRSRSRDDNIDGASSSTRERNFPTVPVS